MIKFPCTECPVYIMCKNRFNGTYASSLFTNCPILYAYVFEDVKKTETGRVMDRINIARVHFGIKPILVAKDREE